MEFELDYPGAVAAFKGEACFTLAYSRDRMLHCVAQLSQDDLWWRPQPGMNAVGNVVLHVCGNLRQWVVTGCDPAGQREDDRQRDAEFSATGGHTGEQLTGLLNRTVEEAQATIRAMNKDDLLRPRFIQIAEVTGMGAVWHSVAHLEGHAQEAIYATRLRLGDRYRFKDQY